MRKDTFFIIAGIVLLMLASCMFVVSGTHLESSEESAKQDVPYFLVVGIFALVIGTFFVSTFFYKLGTGRPRFLQHAEVNKIYEVIGRVSVDGKIIAVLKEQSGKIRLFQFDAYPEATKAFIKIIERENGRKAFESFPPSKKTSSSEKTSVVKDS